MPYKDAAKQKAAQALWFQRKKADPEAYRRRLEDARNLKDRIRQVKIEEGTHRSVASKKRKSNNELVANLIAEAKTNGCIRCDEVDHACLDFHHKDPVDKLFGIAVGRRKEMSVELIRAEIAKCVVFCKNCHSKFHAGRFTIEEV
ncbi:hypothetical protein B9J07_28025 [Sinorhizobium sp. LM21]|nr:hypothetical protein B9J07_28025 [Sinorhizobium sp. LM21]